MLLHAVATAESSEVGMEAPGRHLPLERRRASRVQTRGSHLAETGPDNADADSAVGVIAWADPEAALALPFLVCAVRRGHIGDECRMVVVCWGERGASLHDKTTHLEMLLIDVISARLSTDSAASFSHSSACLEPYV